MRAKKKSDATSSVAPGAEVQKTAIKKASPARSKPAVKRAPKPATAAATHKAPARRTTAKKPAAPVFDVEMHRAEIEKEAYLLWAGRGHEHGLAHEDWLSAIEIVKTRHLG